MSRAPLINQIPTSKEILRQSAGVFESQRSRPDPRSNDHIRVSARPSLQQVASFNGLQNPVTRDIEIVGVELLWDELRNNKTLMAYHGRNVLDIRSLTMYADTVIIRSRLRFQGTHVTIYARRLIFEGRGCIDTTPAPWGPRRERSQDKENTARTFVAADGMDDQKGGDVHLRVREIEGLGNLDENSFRFICNGSDGQASEAGGYRDYEPKDADQQPAADRGPHLDPVTVGDIKNHISNRFITQSWWYPGNPMRVESIDDMFIPGDRLNSNQVVHLKLVARDDNVLTRSVSRTFMPGDDMDDSGWCHAVATGATFASVAALAAAPFVGLGTHVVCVDAVQDAFIDETDHRRLRPVSRQLSCPV
jgi:hypothetical protein